jgi:hypothetical protein
MKERRLDYQLANCILLFMYPALFMNSAMIVVFLVYEHTFVWVSLVVLWGYHKYMSLFGTNQLFENKIFSFEFEST